MGEHQWGPMDVDGVRRCVRMGCGVGIHRDVDGVAWHDGSGSGWVARSRKRPTPSCRGADRCLHVERVALALGRGQHVVGGFKVGQCEREALPRMTVCEYHATPDAVRMVITSLAKEVERLSATSGRGGR